MRSGRRMNQFGDMLPLENSHDQQQEGLDTEVIGQEEEVDTEVIQESDNQSGETFLLEQN